MSKERYLQNINRVFAIYGIDPQDRRYNTHHIIFKSDFKKGGFGRTLGKGYRDSKANLCPLEKGVHRELHEGVDRKGKV